MEHHRGEPITVGVAVRTIASAGAILHRAIVRNYPSVFSGRAYGLDFTAA
jgi:hypothetical protein